jgi:hypothetical protein
LHFAQWEKKKGNTENSLDTLSGVNDMDYGFLSGGGKGSGTFFGFSELSSGAEKGA